MKKTKVIVLVVLLIVLIAIIGLLLGFAIRSIPYNKNAKNPIVTLNIEGYGEVQMELYPDYAPNTVSTIIKLIQNKYYNGKVFYGTDGSAVHVGMIKNEVTDENDSTTNEANAIEDVVTVSDLDTSVVAGSDKDYNISIPGEFVVNGYEENTLRFEKGTVGLYRTRYTPYRTEDRSLLEKESMNSGSSLFFISMDENSALNGGYAPFGKVIKGFDIIEKINTLKTIPEEDIQENQIEYFENLPVINTVTVDTFGVDYGMPEYLEAFDYNSYSLNYLLKYYS